MTVVIGFFFLITNGIPCVHGTNSINDVTCYNRLLYCMLVTYFEFCTMFESTHTGCLYHAK